MDNIYPDQSNDKFDIQYARLLGLSSDIRASFGVAEEGGSPVIKTPDDNSTGHLRFGVAAEDAVAIQNRSFDLNGAYIFQLTQLGNKQFLVDPPNGLYQLGAIPVPGSDSGLSYTYLEIDDTDGKILLQAPEGIVLPGYGYGNHSGTETFFLAVDAGGNLIEVDAPTGGGSVTADNGLTMSTATNVQLGHTTNSGSPLLHNTFINGADNVLAFTGSAIGTFKTTLGDLTYGGAFSEIQHTLTTYYLNNADGSGKYTLIQGAVSGTPQVSIESSTALNVSFIHVEPTLIDLQVPSSGFVKFSSYGSGSHTGTDAYWLAVDSSGNVIEMAAPSGGSITADNGLTMSTSTNVQLGYTASTGSPLLHDTYINGDDHEFIINNSRSTFTYAMQVLNANVSGAGGIYATGQTFAIKGQGGNVGIYGIAPNYGLIGESTGGGVGVQGLTTDGTGVLAQAESSVGTGVQTLINIVRHNATPSNGIGASIDFQLTASNNTNNLSNQIISTWVDKTVGTRTSQLDITGVNSASTQTLASFKGSGQLQLPLYGLGTFTGTDAYWLAVDSSGNIIEMTAPAGGSTNTIYNANDVLASNRVVGFNGKTLNFFQTGNLTVEMNEPSKLFRVITGPEDYSNAEAEMTISSSSGFNRYIQNAAGTSWMTEDFSSLSWSLYGASTLRVTLNDANQTFDVFKSGLYFIKVDVPNQEYQFGHILNGAYIQVTNSSSRILMHGLMNLVPVDATTASAYTASDGDLIYVNSTNGTFTSVGVWAFENGAWVKL